MARIVKFRLITYFDEVPNQVTPQGETVLVERTATMGQEVELRPADEQRLDGLGALYSDEEAQSIADGTYRGIDSEILRGARAGIRPQTQIEPADGEGPQTDSMSAEELADYIAGGNGGKGLNVDQTVALAKDGDLASIEKVLDAENIATNNEPRAGVESRLTAKMKAATEG